MHLRTCLHCSKSFELKNIAYEKRGGGKYCSMQCSKYATKKHSFDENFFDKIDTEAKAYWFGFCMADGCNTGDELKIELSAKDDAHLLLIRNDLKASQTVSYRWRDDNQMAYIGFASRYMCQQLTKLGCVKNKTFALNYPSITNDLQNHFIRGYFDGDGCISANGQWSIFSVSHAFLTQMKNIIEIATGVQIKTYTQGDNGHRIVLYKKDDIWAVHNYLYADAMTFMERKRSKFEDVLVV